MDNKSRNNIIISNASRKCNEYHRNEYQSGLIIVYI